MVPRILTPTLLAALATTLVACGGGSPSPSRPATPRDAQVLSVLRAHYAHLADAQADAACNDQTVGYQNSFASSFKTSSCPAAILTYRKRLTALGSWTRSALRAVTISNVRVAGSTATAHVKLSNPSGGIDVPMGRVTLSRVGGQWMISGVSSD
jgi:hypothetical protein